MPLYNESSQGNGHIFHIILDKKIDRSKIINQMSRISIQCVSHYVPLHTSPMGKSFKHDKNMANTKKAADSLLRLPMWYGLTEAQINQICSSLSLILKNKSNFKW